LCVHSPRPMDSPCRDAVTLGDLAAKCNGGRVFEFACLAVRAQSIRCNG